MIKALFYDFDGVIKDSTQIKTEAFRSLYAPYGKEIADAVVEHHLANGGVSRFEKFRYYHHHFLGKEINEDQVRELANRFSEIVMQKVIECPYVPGALESLQKLKTVYQQYVVTGTPQTEIEEIADVLGIRSLFAGLYGSPQDKIELSAEILQKSDLTSNEVVFIGDALTDYNAAKHFNFTFLLRQHAENIDLFKDIDVIKIQDLTQLESILNNL